MDDQPRVAYRDLSRAFSISRHSLSAIAAAFQLLSAKPTPQEPELASVQTGRDALSQAELQEAK